MGFPKPLFTKKTPNRISKYCKQVMTWEFNYFVGQMTQQWNCSHIFLTAKCICPVMKYLIFLCWSILCAHSLARDYVWMNHWLYSTVNYWHVCTTPHQHIMLSLPVFFCVWLLSCHGLLQPSHHWVSVCYTWLCAQAWLGLHVVTVSCDGKLRETKMREDLKTVW